MKACGLIVEYNPFHNGHLYHLEQAKKITNSDCIVAIMSGQFLQRGEPAIIDKFHRTKAALANGVDLVIELPFAYAVQSSKLFARGAVHSLNELGVASICFGSEAGDIHLLKEHNATISANKSSFTKVLKQQLNQGLSYPMANSLALQSLGLTNDGLDQPNNILGLSYLRAMTDANLPIKPYTIKRIKNNFHDEEINHAIASATSIRKELVQDHLSQKASQALPIESKELLIEYEKKTNLWHTWEHYFPFLHYKVSTMSKEQLKMIHGVDEGLENRLKATLHQATSFAQWISLMKTKRYTHVRLQRMFVHILNNSTKEEINAFTFENKIPYLRLLGMSEIGKSYLNKYKKSFDKPIISKLMRDYQTTYLDERATDVYYTIFDSKTKNKLRRQEFQLPIFK